MVLAGLSNVVDDPSIPVGITAEKLDPSQVMEPVEPDLIVAAPP